MSSVQEGQVEVFEPVLAPSRLRCLEGKPSLDEL